MRFDEEIPCFFTNILRQCFRVSCLGHLPRNLSEGCTESGIWTDTSVDHEEVKRIAPLKWVSVSSSEVNPGCWNRQQHTEYPVRHRKVLQSKTFLDWNQLSKHKCRVIFISYFGKIKSLQQKTEISSQVMEVFCKLIFTNDFASFLKYKVI